MRIYRHVPMKQRIAKNIRKESSGCWVWTAALRNEWGYGRIDVNGRKTLAHRASYECHVAPIPRGMLVLHRCDNPPCVNPSHLFLGTHADNVRDMAEKGRKVVLRGEQQPQAKLTELAVRAARVAHANGASVLSLARKNGVSHRAMKWAIEGVTWAQVK